MIQVMKRQAISLRRGCVTYSVCLRLGYNFLVSQFKEASGKLEPPFLKSYALILSSFCLEAYS